MADCERELIPELAGPKSGEKILDVGIGTGFFVSDILKYRADIIGMDVSEKMLDVARSKGLTNVFTLFAGYDFKLQNTGSFTGANILTAGVKFGSWDRKGFSISFSYFTGKSIHGEYFDLNENYASLGFNMDL